MEESEDIDATGSFSVSCFGFPFALKAGISGISILGGIISVEVDTPAGSFFVSCFELRLGLNAGICGIFVSREIFSSDVSTS